jgi:hypothetical protein
LTIKNAGKKKRFDFGYPVALKRMTISDYFIPQMKLLEIST